MSKVLVVGTSRKTQGGISAVVKLYEQSKLWKVFNCHWIGTHCDGTFLTKICIYLLACVQYVILLPFYDIVHFHISLTTTVDRKYPLFRLAKLYGKKTVVHLHCGSQIDNVWNNKYQYLFEHCDCGILLSEGLKRKIEEHVGCKEKLKVVYNPCPIITQPIVYSKKNTILFSGVLYEAKGYKDLIKAFSMVASSYREWNLVFAGSGEIDEARNLACDTGITNQVEFLGWVDGENKHKLFSEAKVLCLPSYAEGFPMAVLDAWAYGLPVVTTPVGGIPDVGLHGINMLLFPPGNIEFLAKDLDEIMNDGELRKRLAKASTDLAQSKFSLANISNELTDIYNSL